MTTELSLDVSTSHNLKIMRLFDTSRYSSTDTIENYLVEVLPVNKTVWVPFYVSKNFSLALNSSNLGYRKAKDTSCLVNLPDGVYEIKQSYKPNASTISHFYHFRVVELQRKYLTLLSAHLSEECKKDARMYSEEVDALSSIRNYLEAAVAACDDFHDKKLAIKYYNQAVQLIKKYEKECGCR